MEISVPEVCDSVIHELAVPTDHGTGLTPLSLSNHSCDRTVNGPPTGPELVSPSVVIAKSSASANDSTMPAVSALAGE